MQCVLCDEAISNPICMECLTNEMKEWLNEERPALINEVSSMPSIYSEMQPVSTCILCKNSIPVCTHCFTKEIFGIIHQKAPDLEEDFDRQFNYQLTEYFPHEMKG